MKIIKTYVYLLAVALSALLLPSSAGAAPEVRFPPAHRIAPKP